MPSFYVDDIDVEVGEFLDKCSKREIDLLIEYLIEDGHIGKENILPLSKTRNHFDDEWDGIIGNLRGKRLIMSDEDEKLLRDISKKY
jgi:hypothetical protein